MGALSSGITHLPVLENGTAIAARVGESVRSFMTSGKPPAVEGIPIVNGLKSWQNMKPAQVVEGYGLISHEDPIEDTNMCGRRIISFQ
ncbi:MAG: hypothetical protein ACXV29_10405 [Halobacteriota archaeon]